MGFKEGFWGRTDVTIHINTQGMTSGAFNELIARLEALAGGPDVLYPRVDNYRVYRTGYTLCLGWEEEPLGMYSWGGYNSNSPSNNILYSPEEFLNLVGYNDE